MSMFEGVFGNLEDLAAKSGLPAEKIAPLMQEIGAEIASGKTSVAALADTAAAHGVSADTLEQLLAHAGGADGILSKLTGFLDRDGDGNPLNELGSLAKGLFG